MATSLERALEALKSERDRRALNLLLRAWSTAPHPRLGWAIEELGVALEHESAAALRSSTRAKIADAAWDAVRAADRVEDRGALLATVARTSMNGFKKRLEACAGWERDPRVATRYVDLIAELPFRALSSRPAWSALFEQLTACGDPRSHERLDAIDAAGLPCGKTMSAWLVARLPKVLEGVAPAASFLQAGEGTDAEALDQLLVVLKERFAIEPERIFSWQELALSPVESGAALPRPGPAQGFAVVPGAPLRMAGQGRRRVLSLGIGRRPIDNDQVELRSVWALVDLQEKRQIRAWAGPERMAASEEGVWSCSQEEGEARLAWWPDPGRADAGEPVRCGLPRRGPLESAAGAPTMRGSVHALAPHPQGQMVAALHEERRAQRRSGSGWRSVSEWTVWLWRPGQPPERVLDGRHARLGSIVWSPDGRWLVAVGSSHRRLGSGYTPSGLLLFYDVERGRLSQALRFGFRGQPVAWLPTGELGISGSRFNDVRPRRLWAVDPGTAVTRNAGALSIGNGKNRLTWSTMSVHQGRLLHLAAGHGTEVRLVSLPLDAPEQPQQHDTQWVRLQSQFLGWDGERALIRGPRGALLRLALDGTSEKLPLPSPSVAGLLARGAEAICWIGSRVIGLGGAHGTGALIATKSDLCCVGLDAAGALWFGVGRSPRPKKGKGLSGHAYPVTTLIPGAGGFFSGSIDASVIHWRDGAQAQRLLGHAAPIHALALRSDERVLASGDEQGELRCWVVENGQELSGCTLPGPIEQLVWLGGTLFALVGGRLYRWEPGAEEASLVEEVGGVCALAAGPTWLALGRTDRSAVAWAPGAEPRMLIEGLLMPPRSLAVGDGCVWVGSGRVGSDEAVCRVEVR